MAISASMVKELREKTGAGMMDCKKALEESQGELEKAVDWLRAKGIARAAKRADREASEGLIGSYIHDGRIGVLVELNCETDFVAKTDDFKQLLKDLCMHIAANDTQYVDVEAIPQGVIDREKSVAIESMAGSGKPPEVIEKIVVGKIDKWKKEICLNDQPWVHDEKKSAGTVLHEVGAKTGENIKVRRFSKFVLGSQE